MLDVLKMEQSHNQLAQDERQDVICSKDAKIRKLTPKYSALCIRILQRQSKGLSRGHEA